MKKLKIMIVGPVPPPIGGIPLYVKKLLNSKYIKEHFNLILFNTAIPKSIRRFEKSNERSYSSFLSDGVVPGLKLFLYIFTTFCSFAGYLLKVKPAVIQVFTSSFWGFWRSCTYIMIAKLFGIKVIYHLLNAVDVFWEESKGVQKTMIKLFLNECDILIVQSDGIKQFVERISDTPVVAIYNGVETWRYNKVSSKDHFSDGKIQVVFLGGLSKNKGVFDILKAAQLINNNVHFTFVGGGPVNEFEEYAAQLGINQQVKFTDIITEEEKVAQLIASDIFVLPSYAEGQPVAILEAMSCGLPVISSTVGSMPEVVIDGENGFLIEPGDIRQLTEKISILIDDSTLYKKISKHNYLQARKLYDINRVFSEISEVYSTL